MKILKFICCILIMHGSLQAQVLTGGMCADLKRAAALAQTPDKFKKGEGKEDDMMLRYTCSLTFTKAVKAEVKFWNFGKFANVTQYYAVNKPKETALQLFDEYAKTFRSCYPDLSESESPNDLRKSLEVEVSENMTAGLTIAPVYSEDGVSGYSVFFDLH